LIFTIHATYHLARIKKREGERNTTAERGNSKQIRAEEVVVQQRDNPVGIEKHLVRFQLQKEGIINR
tara:strand:+ start:62 stop:262 length:201 start_codon:yes stop_codon:yes gene_type:complete